MKTSQILAAGALLAGCAQACTRVRVDQWRNPNNSDKKRTHITVYDEDKQPMIQEWDNAIPADNVDGYQFREPWGQVDVQLHYYQGILTDKIGGEVGFPKAGYNWLPLKQMKYQTYTDVHQNEHHLYCLWDEYKCSGRYTCGI